MERVRVRPADRHRDRRAVARSERRPAPLRLRRGRQPRRRHPRERRLGLAVVGGPLGVARAPRRRPRSSWRRSTAGSTGGRSTRQAVSSCSWRGGLRERRRLVRRDRVDLRPVVGLGDGGRRLLRGGGRRQRRAVVELAVGTGRVAIPIARAGIAVIGVDQSSEMLAVAAPTRNGRALRHCSTCAGGPARATCDRARATRDLPVPFAPAPGGHAREIAGVAGCARAAPARGTIRVRRLRAVGRGHRGDPTAAGSSASRASSRGRTGTRCREP